MVDRIGQKHIPELASQVSETGVDAGHLEYLNGELHALWDLGRNLILAWMPCQNAIDVLVIPHYLLSEYAAKGKTGHSRIIFEDIIPGSKQLGEKEFSDLCAFLGHEGRRVDLPFRPGVDVPFPMIETLTKRYSISYVEDRAVALFDIVGFSLLSALDQVTQLNSLAYSLNSAHSKMLESDIKIDFARSTTGDGFYIWNREISVQANVSLYNFMHLVLADNAIARGKSAPNTTPHLRGCFHVGGHYEFYQSEGLSPTIYSYIVGDVTIELARMIDHALPGQILVGEFVVPMPDLDTGMAVRIDSLRFIDKAQKTLSNFKGLVLSGDSINDIKCYLTGEKLDNDIFAVGRFLLADKHNRMRNVYNAKVNIYRHESEPIFLGLQTSDLSDFDYVNVDFINPLTA